MLPFEPNPQQLEALQNGATKLWIPFIETNLWGNRMDWCKKRLLDPANSRAWNNSLIGVSPLQPNEQYFLTNTDIEFTVTGVEVKNVQYLMLRKMISLGIKNETAMTERFVPWHDSQYPEQLYSSKPYGFLIAIQLKEK